MVKSFWLYYGLKKDLGSDDFFFFITVPEGCAYRGRNPLPPLESMPNFPDNGP